MQQPKRVMTRYPLWLLVSVQPVYFRETPWSRNLVLQTPGARAPRGMLAAAEAMFTEDWEPHFLLRELLLRAGSHGRGSRGLNAPSSDWLQICFPSSLPDGSS